MSLPDTVELAKAPRLPYLPSTIPSEIAARLSKLEVDASAWWVGQLARYLLRYTPDIQRRIDDAIAQLNYAGPIVGVQIRRTDKVSTTQSQFFAVERYMEHADAFFDRLNVTGTLQQRRIFLASEAPTVRDEITAKFPHYEIVTNTVASQLAEKLETRYTLDALLGTIVDIELLARADFLVCTFSSNVGRFAYELMQGVRHDAKHRVKSLDLLYNNYAEPDHVYRVVEPCEWGHEFQVQLKVGQEVTVRYYHNANGSLLVQGDNLGLVPAYKLEERPGNVPFHL